MYSRDTGRGNSREGGGTSQRRYPRRRGSGAAGAPEGAAGGAPPAGATGCASRTCLQRAQVRLTLESQHDEGCRPLRRSGPPQDRN